ncbi:RHS repeat domain-containing protein [Bdellovibrio bacteriovorus]|uniref:RHS repeat domain-containing protein n=1 Tax=Bdellovibrio bacteriovorus TaxID=959 RepID=UPI0035A628A5
MFKHVPVAVLLLLLYSVTSYSAIAKYVALDYAYGSNPQNNGCSESYNTCNSTPAISSRGTASSCMIAGKNNLYVVAAARPEYKMYFYEYTNNCGQTINANVRSNTGWASAVGVNSGNRVMFLIVTDSSSDRPQEFFFDLTNATKPPPQAPKPLPPDPTNPDEPLPVSSEYKGICTSGMGSSRVSGYSVIDFERRSVSESIPINGAPFYLLYASDRFRPKEYVGQKIPSIGGWSVSSVHYYDYQRNTIFYGNGLISVLHYQPKLESFGNYALLDSDGKHYHFFDINGRHLSTLDAGSNKVVLKVLYTDDGKFVGVEDKFGKKNLISFADGTITSSTGRITRFELGQNGLLASVENADGGRYEIKYLSNRLMSEFKTPGRKASSFEYNEKGHVVMDRGSNGKWLEIRYDDSEKNTTLIGTISSEDKYNFLNLISDNDRSTRVYQSGSRAVSMSASYKNGNSITVDSFGAQAVYVSSPDPQWGNELPYTSEVNSVVENLNLGWTQRKLYDKQNKRQIDVISPKGGKKREFMVLRGDSEKHSYVQYVTPLKNEVMINSYGFGLVNDIKAFDLNLVQFEYDSFGRLTRQKIHERLTTYNYDTQGNMVSLVTPDGQSLRFEYDSMGRVSKQISPNGAATLFSYDLDGNLVLLQTPTNKIHSFGINLDGQMTSYAPPTDGGSESTRYDYDLDGLLSRIVRGDGKVVRIEREKISERVIKVASDDIAITYDYGVGDTGEKNNRPQKALTHDGIGLEYNYLWRLMRSVRTTGEVATNIAFTYGSDASVAAIDVAGRDGKSFQTKFVYDLDGRLQSVGNLQYSYGKSPIVRGSVLGIVRQEIAISGYGEVQAEAYSAGKTVVSKFEYSRNHTGKVVLVKDVLRGISTNYVYDSLGRLVEVVGKDGRRAYSYDENGNRLSHTRGQSIIKGTYDDQDRLISYGTSKYFYNNHGDLERKEELESASGRILPTRYSYDSLGNLRKVILPDGKIVEYIIDGQSRRIGKKINGKLVQGFIYQNQYQIVAELDGTGKVVKRFYYGSKLNSPDYMSTGGKDYKIVSDQVGTPQMIVEAATGKVTETLNIDEFGVYKSGTRSSFIPFGFAGGLFDPDTGLVRFGARDYDPEIGRWTSKDPILFAGLQTNLYGYTFNDPVNFIDPTGTVGWGGAIIGGIVGGVSGYLTGISTGASPAQAALAGAAIGAASGFTGAYLLEGAAVLGVGTAGQIFAGSFGAFQTGFVGSLLSQQISGKRPSVGDAAKQGGMCAVGVGGGAAMGLGYSSGAQMAIDGAFGVSLMPIDLLLAR